MKKYWLLLASISLAVSILSACNTDTGTNNGEKTEPTVVEDETANGEETEPTVVEDETTTDEKETLEERESEKTLSYTVNGEEKEEVATLTESDEQNYSIYKLEDFKLTGEEPNKDALYLTENDAVFMRIETLSKDEGSIEIVGQNMKDTLSAVSIGQEPTTIEDDLKLPQGENISKQAGMEITTDLGTVTGIVFEKDNLIVRLTIFDRKSYNLTDAFLKMGETIAVKQ